MKKMATVRMVIWMILLFVISPALPVLKADIPDAENNRVAYYVFDSGGPDHFPLTTFSDEANIVVIFEGTLWELVDSIHYSTGWMTNINYHYYSEIIRDIRILQSRGIKVLMNIDDHPSWSTSTPFTTYDGQELNYQQYAEFIQTCAIDSLQLDGISLDIEHRAEGNENYKSLLKEIGKYFGPLSANNNSQMYIAAMFKGYWGEPGFEIGRSKDIMARLNFLMDMAYFNGNYVDRFNQWADSIGNSKVMIGVLNDYFDLDFAVKVAGWQPSSGPKAGIMVYAANNLKSYTDSVFKSLVVPVTDVNDIKNQIPKEFSLLQNYPNPFNPSTTISYHIPQGGLVTLKVFDLLGNEITTLIDNVMNPGYYTVTFDGSKYASGLYFARLNVQSKSKQFNKIIKMLMMK
jgi:hypothetical protein